MAVSVGRLIKDQQNIELEVLERLSLVGCCYTYNKLNRDHHSLQKHCYLCTYVCTVHTGLQAGHNIVQYLQVTEEGHSQFVKTLVTMGYRCREEQAGTRCAEGLFPFCNQTPRHHALVSKIV